MPRCCRRSAATAPTMPTRCPSLRSSCSPLSWLTGCERQARRSPATAWIRVGMGGRGCSTGRSELGGCCGCGCGSLALCRPTTPCTHSPHTPAAWGSWQALLLMPPPRAALPPGTVNTKMLSAGWGSIGIPIKVRSRLVHSLLGWQSGRMQRQLAAGQPCYAGSTAAPPGPCTTFLLPSSIHLSGRTP